MKDIAIYWAKLIAGESRRFTWVYCNALNGIIWILVYFFVAPQHNVVLGFGLLFLGLSFLLFERVALLLWFDELVGVERDRQSGKPSAPAKAGGR